MTITEIVDHLNTVYESGQLQGVVLGMLKADGTFDNLWQIHEVQPCSHLIAVGMAASLTHDIQIQATIKDEALRYGE